MLNYLWHLTATEKRKKHVYFVFNCSILQMPRQLHKVIMLEQAGTLEIKLCNLVLETLWSWNVTLLSQGSDTGLATKLALDPEHPGCDLKHCPQH